MTDAYQFEMPIEEHSKLRDVLLNISGKFILSGYHSALYDARALTGAWHRVDNEINNKASSAKKLRQISA